MPDARPFPRAKGTAPQPAGREKLSMETSIKQDVEV